jgi:dTDP-4-amino-4,6-dideoxygalactose transaminase
MTVRIPFARPWLGDAEVEAARRAILSGWVTQGPEVAAFEREFAAAVGAPHACAVSSATAALHLALLAVGVAPGDEVVTVSHSFIATANAVRYCGAMPVFVDVEPRTYNLDPLRLEAAVGPRTKAILCVHQLGMPCDLEAIVALARTRAIPVVEDAACAVGSDVRVDGAWAPVGRPHGNVACFSFHPRKLLTTGDGGMLTTRDERLDARFRLLRQHGMSVPDLVRHASPQVLTETYPVLGFNYRMTDIQAAVGRAQLTRIPDMVARRRELAARYHERLAGVPEIGVPEEPAFARSNWQTYCVTVDEQLDQRAVMQRMLDDGVATRRGVMCAHREGAYPAGTWRAAGSLHVSERIQDRGIALPLYHDMTTADQDAVVAALRSACAAVAAL